MTKKVDFSDVKIKDIEGQEVQLDLRKPLGNVIYMQGQTVEECDLGRAIYYSGGEVELTDEQQAVVKRFAETYPYLTRSAILEALR